VLQNLKEYPSNEPISPAPTCVDDLVQPFPGVIVSECTITSDVMLAGVYVGDLVEGDGTTVVSNIPLFRVSTLLTCQQINRLLTI